MHWSVLLIGGSFSVVSILFFWLVWPVVGLADFARVDNFSVIVLSVYAEFGSKDGKQRWLKKNPAWVAVHDYCPSPFVGSRSVSF